LFVEKSVADATLFFVWWVWGSIRVTLSVTMGHLWIDAIF
jgi:hypothetical protein